MYIDKSKKVSYNELKPGDKFYFEVSFDVDHDLHGSFTKIDDPTIEGACIDDNNGLVCSWNHLERLNDKTLYKVIFHPEVVSVSNYGKMYDDFLKEVELYKREIPYEFHDWIDSYCGKWTASYGNSAIRCLENARNHNIVDLLYNYSTWELFQPFITLASYKDRNKNYEVKTQREKIADHLKLMFRQVLENVYNEDQI